MAWEPFLWIIFAIMNLTLLGLDFYQFLGFSDLEDDYLNMYEFSSRVNSVIVLEYLLHGAFCILFLMTGHWVMFLLSLPPAYYNLKKYLARQHLIDVTEVFRVLDAEKKVRIIKLVFYIIFFGLIIIRLALSVIHAVFGDDEDDSEGCQITWNYWLGLTLVVVVISRGVHRFGTVGLYGWRFANCRWRLPEWGTRQNRLAVR